MNGQPFAQILSTLFGCEVGILIRISVSLLCIRMHGHEGNDDDEYLFHMGKRLFNDNFLSVANIDTLLWVVYANALEGIDAVCFLFRILWYSDVGRSVAMI